MSNARDLASATSALPAVTQRAHKLAPCFKALADENRLALILLLAERPHSVRELTEATGMRQTLVSHHLTPLREQGLIVAQPKGRSNIYSLCCDALEGPLRELAALLLTDRDAEGNWLT
ncbi:ArsR/SmtB family transcription factor [Natronoglycomyces albus]|uniref:Winged helix-turn-helix transcriptional regulator n=1 Tax=Natronoglycomyces albus TaxID=2811108 RepID=A0A895XW42_9ACTN|nr:metalloregulator ArsR/SmtB family transcription factor [Natronoglycomyces albus]QSB06746.1 winged helix-turn-helix transcriptional regulator [Natronoglycomyces albus]